MINKIDVFTGLFCLAGLTGWFINGLHGTFEMASLLPIWAIPASVYGVRSMLNSPKGEEPK